MDHHLSPPHHSPHHKMSLPTFARSIPVEVTAQPASTRTSFTRVDHTRPGTAVGDDGQRDGADPNDEDAPPSLHNEPEEHEEEEAIPQVPQTMVQFLLVSGRRRSMAFEPETTVGRVKELVWNTWPNDWQDERPPAPSFLRILHLGKMLQDDDTLLQLKFPSHIPPAEPATPTIVHLSVRSFVPRGDSAVKKKRRNTRSVDVSEAGTDAETGEHAGSCCCVIC